MDEIFEDHREDQEDFVGQLYWTLSKAIDPLRVELILSGGDVRLAGCGTDGRVIVRLMGPFTRSCAEKRAVVARIEGFLKSKDPRVTAVVPVCPAPEDTL